MLGRVVAGAQSPEERGALQIGEPAPALGLEKLLQAPDGAKATWEALRGKVVILEFWATWCGGCVAAFPHFNELVDELKDEDVVFISITNEDEAYVLKFLQKRPLKTWVGIDADRSLFKAFHIKGIPRTIIVDKESKVVGDTYPTRLTAAAIREVLAGRRPNLPRPKLSDLEEIDADGGPATVFHVWFKPSQAGEAVTFRFSGDSVLSRGQPLSRLIAWAYETPAWRISDQAPQVTGRVLTFSARLPRADQKALLAISRQAIEVTFGLTATGETRLRHVFVLKTRDDRKHRLTPSQWDHRIPPSQYRTGIMTGDGVTTADLARSLEFLVQQPVIDETSLAGRYDYELRYEDKQPETIVRAVREQLGLELIAAERKVEVLVVAQRPRGNSD